MRKDTITFVPTDSNYHIIREWRQRMGLPTKSASINQLIRLGEIMVRYLEAGGGLDNPRDWKVPPKGTMIGGLTEQQREVFFNSLTERIKQNQYGNPNELR